MQIQLWMVCQLFVCWWSFSKWRIPCLMPLKLFTFFVFFFAMIHGAENWSVFLVFQSWFSGSVYISRITEFDVSTGWSMKDLELWIFPIFRLCVFVLIVPTHPPRLGRSWAFFGLVFRQMVVFLKTKHKMLNCHTRLNIGSARARQQAGGAALQWWVEKLAGKFKFITKKRRYQSVATHN